MPRNLVIINAILLVIAAASVAFIVRQMMTPMPLPLPTRGRPAPAASASAGSPETGRPPFVPYTTVVSKNLFSPTRTEAPVTPAVATAVNAPKPNLFGVVLRDGAPVAYLEDPATRRVSGYRVGDAVAGGTVQAITGDTVTITRPDGKMDVRLRDPGKPRPPAAPPTAAVPGAQPVALPGVIPPATPPAVAAPMPPSPGVLPPQPGVAPSLTPGRRPLPPNLLRRLPQPPPTDASQE
jgi:hypothetical protein